MTLLNWNRPRTQVKCSQKEESCTAEFKVSSWKLQSCSGKKVWSGWESCQWLAKSRGNSYCRERKTDNANGRLKTWLPKLEEWVRRLVFEQQAADRGLSTVHLRLHAQVIAKEMDINDFAGRPSSRYHFMQRSLVVKWSIGPRYVRNCHQTFKQRSKVSMLPFKK